MGVTLKNVAKLAEVSIGTVSQALNNKACISPGTKEKVLLAVRKLNYYPHTIAKQLALQRTNYLTCFIIPNEKTSCIHLSSWSFYYPIIQSILNVTRSHNYKVLLEICGLEDIKEETLLNLAREKSVDGAFFILQIKDNYINILKLKSMGFPTIVINANLQEGINSVCVDNIKTVQKVIKYLVSLGHQEIAFMSGPMNHLNSLERLQGYKETLYDLGIKIKKQWIVEGDWTIESGYRCAGRIINFGVPTAIFCSNDYMAVGAMKRIKEAGLSIPEDVSIMGYDDMDIARVVTPSLSSVKQPLDKVGELAAEELIRLVEGKKTNVHKILLKPEIIKRQSCAAIK